MKIKTLLTLLFAISFFFQYAFADGPTIKFEKEIHDFGKIKEDAGSVKYTFKFINEGSTPLVIQNVRPSCGCTTPDWTREPVLPGKTGFIKAVFNPRNRPGAFNKSLTVTTNAEPAISRLYIKGIVEPKPRTIADDYPTVLGGIRVKYRSFNFGKITTEKPVTRSFNVYNDSEENITFLDEVQSPDFIKVRFEPKTLAPKKLGNIIVTYDPTKEKRLGFVSSLVVLKTNEKQNNIKDFRAVASVEEYFPPMTAEQLAKAPKLKFDNPVHDFGKIKQGDQVSTEFVFTNAGKGVLNIRNIRASCGCTISNLEKNDLGPGESASIKITFNSRGRRGIQQKSISVFSNDPANPTQRITIKARVEVDDKS
jgi:hypothetical protein